MCCNMLGKIKKIRKCLQIQQNFRKCWKKLDVKANKKIIQNFMLHKF